MINKNVKLYLGNGYPVRIPVSQFDTGWTFTFTIYYNGIEWTIPAGSSVVMNGLKPDGNVFAFSGLVLSNKVVVEADVQMTAVAGDTICELSILSDGKTVGTANFTLAVEAAPKSPDDVSSDSTLPAYAEMLEMFSGDIEDEVDSWLNAHSSQIGGLTNEAKQALLTLLAHVAYTDDQGQTYLDALEAALYPPADLVSISAVFNQGQNVIYNTDSLDTLKQYLTVTAHMSDGTSNTVTTYTLSGTLTEGTSTIVASYGGKTTTFAVTVTNRTDTTAQIEYVGKLITHRNYTPSYVQSDATNGGITIKYQMDTPTATLFPAGIIPTDSVSTMTPGGYAACLVVYDDNGNEINYVNELSDTVFTRWVQSKSGTMTEFSQSWNLASTYSQIAFSVDMRYLDDAYMYDKTTGQVWFAGINTPYYGMSNISEAQ